MRLNAKQFEDTALEQLSQIIRRQRWFRSKSKSVDAADLEDFSFFEAGGNSFVLPLIRFAYSDGSSETYFVPLLCSEHEHGAGAGFSFHVHAGGSEVHFSDALHDSTFVRSLLFLMERGATIVFAKGRLTGRSMMYTASMQITAEVQTKVVSSEQSNTSVMIGNHSIYKSYRRIDRGINPDYEMPEFLYAHTTFRALPRPLGRLEYLNGGEHAVGVLSEYVENEGDCWTYFLSRLTEALKRGDGVKTCFEHVAALAGITSSMHNALSGAALPAFTPSPVNAEDINGWMSNYESLLHSTCATLRRSSGGLTDEDRKLALSILDAEYKLSRAGSALRVLSDELVCATRIHGDYHLGQILKAGTSFFVIDFEGEPMRPPEERRRMNSPLKDVGGMLRSLDYVIGAAARSAGIPAGDETVESWRNGAAELFTVKYMEGYSPSMPYLPSRFADMADVLHFFLVEKAVYELDYELNNRPDWVHIPLDALVRLSAASGGPY